MGALLASFASTTYAQAAPAPTPIEQAGAVPPTPATTPANVPPLTDEDRRAAFPDVERHDVHDRAINYFVLFDQLEWQGKDGPGLNWDNRGWIGGDRDRFWFRTEGEGGDAGPDSGQVHALYGRAIGRWWDLVAGVRQDVGPGPDRTWAAVGIQGLAPYWFEVEATMYVGAAGRTHVRFETEYELLVTNRLVLQPLAEVEIYGKADPERRVAAGLGTIDAGLRLRYEFRREFAPYVGLTWSRKYFGTADFARNLGDRVGGARLALGLRLWF